MNTAEQIPEKQPNLAEQVKKLEQEKLELKARLKEAITDPVTGLERRSGLFEDIHDELMEILSAEELNNLETLTGQDLVKFLDTLITNEQISKRPLCLMMSDVAYLSLANKSGLEGGDSLLAGIGDAARSLGSPEIKLKEEMTEDEKKPIVKFFRHGGDEITAIVRLPLDQANKKLDDFANQVEGVKGIKDFEDNNLKPHIDFGVAHLLDAVMVFQNIAADPELQEDIPPSSRLKSIENIWMQIAEIEATIKKNMERITLLTELKINNPELYDEVIAYLRKGAQNISDINLDKIISKTQKQPTSASGQQEIYQYIISELQLSNSKNSKIQIMLNRLLQNEKAPN
jgi:GGDEF domain-containing protein